MHTSLFAHNDGRLETYFVRMAASRHIQYEKQALKEQLNRPKRYNAPGVCTGNSLTYFYN